MGLWKAREPASWPPSLSSQILSVNDMQRLTEKHYGGQNCTRQGFFAIVDNVNNCNVTEACHTSSSTLHVQHTFLYISLPLFCRTTTWNSAWNFLVTRFMEECCMCSCLQFCWLRYVPPYTIKFNCEMSSQPTVFLWYWGFQRTSTFNS